MKNGYHRRTTCRGCGHKHLTQVLDLGTMPPANAFLSKDQFAAERAYPLTLAFCEECSLVQVPDVIDSAILFKDYVYATGSSAPLVEHFRKYAEDVVLPLVSGDDLVVDIGGNDSTLLNFVKSDLVKSGYIRTLNVDPAVSNCGLAMGVALLFSSDVAKRVLDRFGPAKVITANNVLAHTDDPFDFVRGVRHLLADDGTFIFEVHWVKDLIDHTGYDQIYHEHLCYFSLHALDRMLEAAELELIDAQVVQNHGQSLRIKAIKSKAECIHGMSEGCYDIGQAEALAGLHIEDTYIAFAKQVETKRHILRDLLFDLSDGGARIVGYGAPAKGNTLLNYCGIEPSTLPYIVDGSPAKQGLYTPGTHIPIVKREAMAVPDYALLLSWNYKEHILAKEADLRLSGTKFIVPFPEIRII